MNNISVKQEDLLGLEPAGGGRVKGEGGEGKYDRSTSYTCMKIE
jgi:hypothetical protein